MNEPPLQNPRRRRLSVLLFICVVIGSLLFALLSSAVQLCIRYRQDIRAIEASLDMVETTHLPSIAGSLYAVNDGQLKIHLAGLLNYRDVAYVELVEHRGDQRFELSAGDPNAARDIVRILPVIYENAPAGPMELGLLTVSASRKDVYNRLIEAGFVILLSTTLQTFLIALLVLAFFHFVVTRNLARMARYADHMSADRLDIPLTLPRRRFLFRKPDEFDQVADAVNDLRRRLQQDIERREETEHALRESETRFRKLVEQASDAIYLADPEGRLVDANEMACKWLGYAKEELLSLHVWNVDERFHSRDRYQKIADALKPGQPVEIETHFLRKDGSTLPVEVRLGGVELKTGRHVLAMVRDITERKKTEGALIAEKAFSEAIIDALPGLFFLYDDQGVIERWNLSYERQTGYLPDEIKGKRYLDWIVPENRPAAQAKFKEAIESGRAEIEVGLIHRDGRTVPYRVFGVRLTMDGQPFVVGMAFDITEQKAMEAEIKASETRYRIVSDHTHDWEYWLAPEGHLLYCSPSCRRITGYPADDFISMPDLLNRIVHPEDLPAYDDHIRMDLANREPGLIEFRILCAEGEVRWIEHVCQPVFEAGQYLGIRAGNRDITDRKRAEAEKARLEGQLRHAQKMEAIGTLAGGIAHDFNNILGGIIGYAELAVERTPPDDAKLTKYTGRILEGGRRAKDLVAQILTVSRQAEMAFSVVDVAPIVKEALKLLRSSLPTTIEIRQEVVSGVTVMADPSQIHQVVMNLCTNAAHAMGSAGGVLTVTLSGARSDSTGIKDAAARCEGRHQVLTVGDTGSGIPDDILDKIFDPYFTTKAQGEGTGLGLAVVDGIVKKMGGHIAIRSEQGRGTEFSVYLPEHAQPTALTAEPEAEALPTGSEHILVVDDEEMLMELSAEVLQDLGYRVTTAASAETALRIFCEDPDGFDAVVTDMTMPRMTGLELAREVVRIQPGTPILLCTGYNKDISEDDVGRYGVRGLIFKPISKVQLAKTVREIMDSR